jgi:ribonuclease D
VINDILYVDTAEKLNTACRAFSTQHWLAVDTEFIREKSYFAKLALIQIATANQIYCIDPLAVEDLGPLLDILEHHSAVKVFHAAGQDIETLFHQRGSLTTPIFDTQVAASLLGFGEQTGYAEIVRKLLDVTIDKRSVRTDWLKRPLSEMQIRYAADDVRYLSQIYPLLVEGLKAAGRLEWMADELTHLQDPSVVQPDPENAWARVKGAGKLNRRQRNVLRHLAAWREREAMKVDKPRKWIVSDDVIIDLALQLPDDAETLRANRRLSGKTLKRYTAKILAIIATARNAPEAQWPTLATGKRPTMREEAILDMLMAVVRIKAREHSLSPGQITTRHELLALIRGSTDLPLQKGWRSEIAGRTISSVLDGTTTLVCNDGTASLIPAAGQVDTPISPRSTGR